MSNSSTETVNLTITVSTEVLDADLSYITVDNNAIIKFDLIVKRKKLNWTLILF